MADGRRVGRKRVARPMPAAGLAGVRPSLAAVGEGDDNAMCESFFATLECTLLKRHRLRSQGGARIAVFEFVEGWYNPRRRHSASGYLSPADPERSTLPRARPGPKPSAKSGQRQPGNQIGISGSIAWTGFSGLAAASSAVSAFTISRSSM